MKDLVHIIKKTGKSMTQSRLIDGILLDIGTKRIPHKFHHMQHAKVLIFRVPNLFQVDSISSESICKEQIQLLFLIYFNFYLIFFSPFIIFSIILAATQHGEKVREEIRKHCREIIGKVDIILNTGSISFVAKQ